MRAAGAFVLCVAAALPAAASPPPNFDAKGAGGARYGWKMMGGKLVDLLARIPLNWNNWIRQIHRWLSIVFTLTVIANFVAMTQGQPPAWVTYSPLLPLALLSFTGLYLFVLPYATKWRSGRRTD